MIPKVIHYCWFGKAEIPENLQKCIDSWKKVMPDYEIKRWDETNYNINKCNYIKEAYEAKKWAFVSDYARLDILYTYGGIYLDTDVEVLKKFDDLLTLTAFCGMELDKGKIPKEANTGLAIGMVKGCKTGKILRDDYENKHFKREDGSYDLTPCPTIQTRIFKEMGLQLNNKIQVIGDFTIFPTDYFCPMNQYTGKINITKNTYSIHHYYDSWNKPADVLRRKLRIQYSKYGGIISEIVSTLVSYKKYYGIFGMWKEIIEKIYKR